MGVRYSFEQLDRIGLKTYRADLHVHTVLSPCAAIEMIPPLIVQEAISSGINLIAISDHNASGNVASVQKAAAGTDLVVLPAMEVQTREEVHVLCLFDTLDQVEAWQNIVNSHLPDIENKPDFFGEQFMVDQTGEFIRREERMLINSIDLSFEEAGNFVTNLGGLFIPAHINRKAFGLIANLGLVPEGVDIIALEISRQISPPIAYQTYPQIKKFPLIQDGDVHYINEFLGSMKITMEEPNIKELSLAILQENARSLIIA
jgi:3',5'-nucleoside bisphosphate phosphatase